MSRSIASAAIVGLVATASAKECVSVIDAAKKAGLTNLIDFANQLAQDAANDENIKVLLPEILKTTPLPEDDRVTIFAPTNKAFEEAKDVIDSATIEDKLYVLFDHVVPGELKSSDITKAIKDAAPSPASITSIVHLYLDVTSTMESIFVAPNCAPEDKSKVIEVDIETCVGTIHVIDKVIVAYPSYGYDDDYSHHAYAPSPYSHHHDDYHYGTHGQHNVSSDAYYPGYFEHAASPAEHHYDEHKYYPAEAPVHTASPDHGSYGDADVHTVDVYPMKDMPYKAPDVPTYDAPVESSASTSSASSESSGSTGSSGSSSTTGSSSGGISGAAIGGIIAGVAAVAVGAGYAYKRRRAAGPAGNSAALSV